MLHRIFEWLYTRKGPRGRVKPAGEYRPNGLPYHRAFGKAHFGKYETFPRLRRFLVGALFLLVMLALTWLVVESFMGLSIFNTTPPA